MDSLGRANVSSSVSDGFAWLHSCTSSRRRVHSGLTRARLVVIGLILVSVDSLGRAQGGFVHSTVHSTATRDRGVHSGFHLRFLVVLNGVSLGSLGHA